VTGSRCGGSHATQTLLASRFWMFVCLKLFEHTAVGYSCQSTPRITPGIPRCSGVGECGSPAKCGCSLVEEASTDPGASSFTPASDSDQPDEAAELLL
jgi:hypothetical protein